VNRALAELNQLFALDNASSADETKALANDATMLNWLKNHSIETDPYVVPDGRISARQYAGAQIQDLKQAVERCGRAVSDRGYDMIVLDQSRPEVEFSAARVVIPGLRHFWARLREGRLYQAPVDMGWLPHALREEDLNPTPFFL